MERRRAPGEVDAAATRARFGPTRDGAAARSGLDARTVERWEQQGRFTPDPPTRALSALIARDPAAVEAMLAA